MHDDRMSGKEQRQRLRCHVMARRLAFTWVFNTVALFIATWLLSGLSYGSDWWALLIAGLVFTLVNFFLKPVLAILSIPFILVTFGLFYFLINVLMLYLTHWIVPQFTIASFWWAALAAIIISAVNGIQHMLFGHPREHASAARA
jgi:putative membrane protein